MEWIRQADTPTHSLAGRFPVVKTLCGSFSHCEICATLHELQSPCWARGHGTHAPSLPQTLRPGPASRPPRPAASPPWIPGWVRWCIGHLPAPGLFHCVQKNGMGPCLTPQTTTSSARMATFDAGPETQDILRKTQGKRARDTDLGRDFVDVTTTAQVMEAKLDPPKRQAEGKFYLRK